MRILLALVVGWPVWCYAASDGQSAGFALDKGVYRVRGQCLSMTSRGRDEVSKCKGSISIITDNPAEPFFLFQRSDGSWLFETTSPVTYSEDGVATYPVMSLLDSVENRAFNLSGECILDPSGTPTLKCASWYAPGAIVKEASFMGVGKWIFSKSE